MKNVDMKKQGVEDASMDGVDFLKELGGLDASIVAEAAQEEELLCFKKRRRIKFAAAAAAVLLAVCLTAGGGMVVASVLGIEIFNMKANEEESSYGIGFSIKYRPQNAFGGQIDEAKAAIQQQCEEYELWYDSIPNLWTKNFDDWESALAFFEIDFMEIPVTSQPPTDVKLSVWGTAEGALQYVSLFGSYPSERYNIYVMAQIYVDDSEEEVEEQTFSATRGEADYSCVPYTTANGIPCMIVDTLVSEKDGSTHAEGYMVKDGIMYQVSVVPQQQNGEKGKDRMEIVKTLLEEIAEK